MENTQPIKKESKLVRALVGTSAVVTGTMAAGIGATLGSTLGSFSGFVTDGEADIVRMGFVGDMQDMYPNHPKIAKAIDVAYLTGRTLGQLAIAGAIAYVMWNCKDTSGF